jgi:CBS domain containing-hemolysin-like protein
MDVSLTICAIVALVGLNAFFVISEFALVSARTRTDQLRSLADAGDTRARLALQAIDRLDDTISGTQIGITCTSLALGWIGHAWLTPHLIVLLHALSIPSETVFPYLISGFLVFPGLVFLHVVFGKIVPKSVASVQPERLSRWVARPLLLFTFIARPAIRLLHTSATEVLAFLGLNPPTHTERVHAPEEFRQLLSESRDHGLVEESDADMIAGVLDLSNTSVREAMTPRTEICAVERQWPLEKIINVVQHEGYSRLPVYDADLDHIVGILLVKDLLAFFDRTTPFSADKVMREPFFTTPTMLVDDLMEELQQHNAHMAIVVDEYGGTLGLITLEDLIEGIVGDIFDEFDQADDDAIVEATAEGHLSVPGDMPIQDLNERYDLNLSAGDYVTVAGLVLSRLGHIPNVGQVTTIDGVAFHVTAMERQRIERLEVILPDTAESPFSSASDTTA